MKNHQWKTLKSTDVYKSQWLRVRHDEVIKPNGQRGTYDVVEKSNFVLIIPKRGENFFLVDQFRYPIKARSLEFPQGTTEKDEDTTDAVNRELSEETGLTSNKIEYLGFLWLANGHHTQGYSIYIADNCQIGIPKLEDSESDMITKKLSFTELKRLVNNNTIKDSPTVAAFGLYISKR